LEPGELTWAELVNVAECWEHRGNRQQEEKVLRLALKQLERQGNRTDAAMVCGRLSDSKLAQGDPEAAERFARRARELLVQRKEPMWRDVLVCELRLGMALAGQSRYDEAVSLYRGMLQTLDEHAVTETEIRTRVLLELGRLLGVQGQTKEAQSLLVRVLEQYESRQVAEDEFFSRALYGLAELERADGRLKEAATLLKRSLEVQERLGQAESVLFDLAAQALILTLSASGELEEAEAVCRRLLASREKALGPEHPAVDAAASQLMWLNSHLERLDRAFECLERILSGFERLPDQEQNDMAESLGQYVVWLRRKGLHAEAAAIESRVLAGSSRHAAHFQTEPMPWTWN
jgi:tetratricopeptide (TPR) repeat protein